VSALRIRGFALPDGEPADLFAAGDRWTDDPVAGAELAAEGWLLPGLADVHTHPGAEALGQPLDEALLREDLRAHLAAGVTMIRSPGLAGHPPASARTARAGTGIWAALPFIRRWSWRPQKRA